MRSVSRALACAKYGESWLCAYTRILVSTIGLESLISHILVNIFPTQIALYPAQLWRVFKAGKKSLGSSIHLLFPMNLALSILLHRLDADLEEAVGGRP